MFPIRDHNPSEKTPYVTRALIAINVAVFLIYWPLFSDDRALYQFYFDWALIPENVADGRNIHGLITSMFLHGGVMHLAGNMLFLWIFGDNLEEDLGHVKFALFYLASGIGAGLIHVLAAPYSLVPTVGASGAIAGVMGGYLLLYPKAKVDVLFIFVVFFKVWPIPAWIMLGIWFGIQLLNGIGTNPDMGGVAYWAHIGGFLVGFLLIIPVWLRLGATAYWNRTHGHPDHPTARYDFATSSIPKVSRRK
jgi:membrane associated rhomboid family serine protease